MDDLFASLSRIAAKWQEERRLTFDESTIDPAADPRDAADAIARANGFRPLGPRWREIDREAAESVAVSILHRDLAYGAVVMVKEQAEDFATRMLDSVSPVRACFTNGSWDTARDAWLSITDSTFDAGVVCVGADRAVLLWVEDED